MTEKSVLETFDEEGRDLCAGQENMGWTLKFPYILECEEEKAVPKSYSFNFCTLKVFFLVLLFYIWGVGGVICFFNCLLKAARPQCCDPGHPCGGKKP